MAQIPELEPSAQISKFALISQLASHLVEGYMAFEKLKTKWPNFMYVGELVASFYCIIFF